MDSSVEQLALSDLTVLELGSFITAPYCGKLLADLGANVIKIEPPRKGDISRHHGPFPGDIPHPERSGLFLYLNTSKLGITLNLETTTGKLIFEKLVQLADVLVVSQPLGLMDTLELGFERLRLVNPRLVMTSITPFGQDGPYRQYKAHSINLSAATSISHRIGHPDREPLEPAYSRIDYWSGLGAALATMLAIRGRSATNQGQYIDFSKFECTSTMQNHAVMSRMLQYGTIPVRGGHRRVIAGFPWYLGRCKDGFMFVMTTSERHWQRFLNALSAEPWTSNPRYHDRVAMQQEYPDESEALLKHWLAQRTRQEVWDFCRAHEVPFQPVLTIEESINSEHMQAREFMQSVDHPETGMLQYPGFPAKLSETPFRIRQAAPRLGEHNEEIYCGRLGYSQQNLALMRSTEII